MSERSPSLKIEPAVEIYCDPEFDLWPTLGPIPGGHISLSGDLTDEQVGSVIHASLHWFYYDDEQQPAATIEEYLGRAVKREVEGTAVIVWGGPAFVDTVAGVTMTPGCCVALDEGDEVYGFLAGRSEFASLGHSPDTALPAWTTRHVPTHATELIEAVAEGLRISEPSDEEKP